MPDDFLPALTVWRPRHRVIAVTGHYGAGKTNVAVNLALALRGSGDVALCDIDIVNPYFRSADNRALLEEAGVRCFTPEFANSNLDIPSLPPQLASLCDGCITTILDVGGDDDGSAALGGLRETIARTGYEMLYVVSALRPLTADPADAADCLRAIEERCGLKATAVVDNTNLGPETTAEILAEHAGYADEVCRLTGLPLAFRSVLHTVADGVPAAFPMRDVTRRNWV